MKFPSSIELKSWPESFYWKLSSKANGKLAEIEKILDTAGDSTQIKPICWH